MQVVKSLHTHISELSYPTAAAREVWSLMKGRCERVRTIMILMGCMAFSCFFCFLRLLVAQKSEDDRIF